MEKLRVLVDNRVRIEEGALFEQCSREVVNSLVRTFEHHNPDYVKNLRMCGWPRGEPQKLVTWRREDGEVNFPRGGLPRVRSILESAGVVLRLKDARSPGSLDFGDKPLPPHKPPGGGDLWSHQAEAVAALLERENCLLRAATGSGKTSVALALASAVKVPTLVIVPTSPLFEQWIARAGTELSLRGDQVGIVKASQRRLRPLTIALRHSLAKRVTDDMCEYFGCVIVDEVQTAPAKSCYEIIDEFPARYRFGISADEARKDRKECLTRDLFGDVAYEISREACVDRGVTIDVEMRVVPTEFDAPWYRGDEGDFETDAIAADPNFGRLIEEMIRDEQRDSLVESIVKHEVQTAKEQVVVLTRRREHTTSLDAMFTSLGIASGVVMGGEDYRLAREQTLRGIATGTIRVGVGTLEAIGTGVDMPSVGVGVMATPISKNKQLLGQVWGRFCRKPQGKSRARLYYLLDHKVFGLTPLRAMVRDYRNVSVLDRGRWVAGKDYLRGVRPRRV